MRRAALAAALVVALLSAGCLAPTAAPHYPDLGRDNHPDPSSDRLVWEQGYWYNESLAVDATDGLNASERNAVVSRSMARVEHLRGVEFDRPVPVEVVSREAYRERVGGGDASGNRSTTGPTDGAVLHDATYEALFLVGERSDAGARQRQNQEVTVAGFYSPSADRIVVVSDSRTPTVDETTLGHELVHAFQFRHLDPTYNESTRELFSRSRALIEGDARLVDSRYRDHCRSEWNCLRPGAGSGSGDGGGSGEGGDAGAPRVHLGIFLLDYFPYSDGPVFVRHFQERGGWERVNRLYDAPPQSSEQVIEPRKYHRDAPTNVSIADRSSDAWARVHPRGTPDYAAVGMPGITAMFAYPSYDDTRRGGVLSPQTFLNLNATGQPDSLDPVNYDVPPADGWDGDKLIAYRRGDEVGYVWRLAWDTPRDARQFADGYRTLLQYWGGEQVSEDTWVVRDGEFADAFRLTVEGDTVTVVNAPTRADLDGVHRTG